MKLPLLVMANPRTTRLGPIVKLPEGDWNLEHNIIDTSIVFEALGNSEYRIRIDKSGSESSITIYAIKCP
jgi:hypothetical protein